MNSYAAAANAYKPKIMSEFIPHEQHQTDQLNRKLREEVDRFKYICQMYVPNGTRKQKRTAERLDCSAVQPVSRCGVKCENILPRGGVLINALGL